MNKIKKIGLLLLLMIIPFSVTKSTEVFKSEGKIWTKQINTTIDIKLDQNKICIYGEEELEYFVYNSTINKYGEMKVYSMKGFVKNDDTCLIVICDYGNGQKILTINTAEGRVKYIIKD